MKLIASENYYQKRVWSESSVELEMKREAARRSQEEEEALLNNHHQCLERAFERYEQKQKKTVIKPDPWRRWKFGKAAKLALAAAKHFEMNVRIEASDTLGVIRMQSDQIMTDASVWCDNKQKRQLLWPMHLAENVIIDTTDEYGVKLINITLMYKLAREWPRKLLKQ